MKKSLLYIGVLFLGACSSNYENYYLNNLDVSKIEKQVTAETVLENVMYAKILNEKSVERLFGNKLKYVTVVYFKVENKGSAKSFFSVNKAQLSQGNEENKIKRAKLADLIDFSYVEFNNAYKYSNPFRTKQPADSNFAYNLFEHNLKDFVLEIGDSKAGFMIFDQTESAKFLNFTLTNGSSIYTSKDVQLPLDR